MRFRPRLIAYMLIFAGLTMLAGFTTALAIAVASDGKEGQSGHFKRAVWLKPVGYCTKSDRGRMVEDVVASHLKAGMTMKSVRRLLGAPNEVTEDGVWFYNVSAEDNFFLPTCVGLELKTQRGRLQRAIVTRDD